MNGRVEKIDGFFKVLINGSIGYINQDYLEETYRKIKNIKWRVINKEERE